MKFISIVLSTFVFLVCASTPIQAAASDGNLQEALDHYIEARGEQEKIAIVGCGRAPYSWTPEGPRDSNAWMQMQDPGSKGIHTHEDALMIAETEEVQPDVLLDITQPIPEELFNKFDTVYFEKLPPVVLNKKRVYENALQMLKPNGDLYIDFTMKLTSALHPTPGKARLCDEGTAQACLGGVAQLGDNFALATENISFQREYPEGFTMQRDYIVNSGFLEMAPDFQGSDAALHLIYCINNGISPELNPNFINLLCTKKVDGYLESEYLPNIADFVYMGHTIQDNQNPNRFNQRTVHNKIYHLKKIDQCALPNCKEGQNLKRCAGCKKVQYCSREHQSKHWKTHKPKCMEARKNCGK